MIEPCVDRVARVSTARVWLAAGLGTTPEPTDQPTVSDNQMRVWLPTPDGRYNTRGGRQHATWGELRARYDLVEVTAGRLSEAIRWGWGAPRDLVLDPLSWSEYGHTP
ncbi:MAG: hypothetical protein ACRDQX_16685 [Pseudonocardiaceae bacterium]